MSVQIYVPHITATPHRIIDCHQINALTYISGDVGGLAGSLIRSHLAYKVPRVYTSQPQPLDRSISDDHNHQFGPACVMPNYSARIVAAPAPLTIVRLE